MFDAAASLVKVPGIINFRRTGWVPSAPKEFAKVVKELPPPVGGKGPVPFAPSQGTWFPWWCSTSPPPPKTSV